MKQKNTIIFSSVIGAVFLLTAIIYITSLAVEFNKGASASQERFTTLTQNIVRTLQTNTAYADVSAGLADALGDTRDIVTVTIKSDSQNVFSYPINANAVSSTSSLVRSYSTSIPAANDNTYILSATLYLLKPSSIFYKGRIAFIVLLAATIASIVYLIMLSKQTEDDGQPDTASIDSEEDESPFNPEKIINEEQFVSDEDFDNIDLNLPVYNKDSVKANTDLDEGHHLFGAPADTDISATKATAPTDDTVATEPENQVAVDSLVSQMNQSMSTYDNTPSTGSSDDAANDHPNGLFSPATGFGWESYMLPRLDSELVRAASNEQDLALFTMRIPCIDWKNPRVTEIKKLILNTFKFNDLVFEYTDDGCTAIMQNTNIDKALSVANELHIAVTSLLAKAGLDQNICIGISSRSLRLISGSRLSKESEQALIHALEDKDAPVVAFRVNTQKYREYLASELGSTSVKGN